MSPVRPSRTNEGFVNLETVAEKHKLDRPWAWGKHSLDAARRAVTLAAKKVWQHARGAPSIEPDDLEDAAQECLLALFESAEKPKTQIEEEEFLFERARQYLGREYTRLSRFSRPKNSSAEEAPLDALYMRKGRFQGAAQETHLEVGQAAVIITQLPSKLIPMARLMADGAELPDVATELNLGLFDAMAQWRKITEIAVRLRDDALDSAIIKRPIAFRKSKPIRRPEKPKEALVMPIVSKRAPDPVKHQKRMRLLQLISDEKAERQRLRFRRNSH